MCTCFCVSVHMFWSTKHTYAAKHTWGFAARGTGDKGELLELLRANSKHVCLETLQPPCWRKPYDVSFLQFIQHYWKLSFYIRGDACFMICWETSMRHLSLLTFLNSYEINSNFKQQSAQLFFCKCFPIQNNATSRLSMVSFSSLQSAHKNCSSKIKDLLFATVF